MISWDSRRRCCPCSAAQAACGECSCGTPVPLPQLFWLPAVRSAWRWWYSLPNPLQLWWPVSGPAATKLIFNLLNFDICSLRVTSIYEQDISQNLNAIHNFKQGEILENILLTKRPGVWQLLLAITRLWMDDLAVTGLRRRQESPNNPAAL